MAYGLWGSYGRGCLYASGAADKTSQGEAGLTAAALKGEDYCQPVPDSTFGKFGTVSLNEPRAQSWRGALVTKAVGGYGYSGWIWETVDGRFRIKQGPTYPSGDVHSGVAP